jgi:hypothetical protein
LNVSKCSEADNLSHISTRMLKGKTSQWGYFKNLKRRDVQAILQEKALREYQGKEGTFTINSRPVNLRRVESHKQRAGLPDFLVQINQDNAESSNSATVSMVACRTPPPMLSQNMPVAEYWRVSEKLLFDINVLVQGSFEAGRWKYDGIEMLILSAQTHSNQENEKKALHQFLGGLNLGIEAANARDYDLALEYWMKSFIPLETLVKGQYHDTIPNIIQKINDLCREGLGPVAASLTRHIANYATEFLEPGNQNLAIFQGLAALDEKYMVEVEQLVMRKFNEYFEFYLGRYSYNSFVMMTNAARRRLLQNPWTTFEDSLPDIPTLDEEYGPTNRRTLDILSLRVETSRRRNMNHTVAVEAQKLLERAALIQGDEWQRLYNGTRASFFLGSALYDLGRYSEAFVSFSDMLHFEEEFRKVEKIDIFAPERSIAENLLGKLIMDGVMLE